MPCTYTGSIEGDRALAAEQLEDALTEELDEMTALACAAFTQLEKYVGLGLMTPEQQDWWRRHKEADRIRKEEEDMSVKLTPKQAAQQMMLTSMANLYRTLVSDPAAHELSPGYAKKAARFVAKDHNKLLKRSNLDGTELSEEP